ncbi:unnamed protein product [Closterium sp. NIES-64]|nr:unnamed protein product [Closterium sp. NIES-64]
MAFTHRQRRLSRESMRRALALLLLALLAGASFAKQSNDFSQDVKNAVDSSSRRARDAMKRLGKDSRAILDAKSNLISLEASAMKLVNEIVSRTGKNITKPQKALTSIVRRVVAAVDVLKKAGLFRGGAEVQPKNDSSSKNQLRATATVASLSSSRTGLRRAKPAAPEPCNGWICIDISITGIILALKAFFQNFQIFFQGFISGFFQGFITGFVQIAAFLAAAFEAFFFALFSCKGATTMLFPMDALVWAGALTVLSGKQLADVANYNMLDGLYPYDIMQSAGWMARFKTQLPDQTVTKVFGQGSPMVVLMGRLGIPSVVLWPNFYVGRSLIVHIVSTSLVPTLTS